MLENEYVKTIILGIVQGITEFLPISSDGHLVILGALLFKGKDPNNIVPLDLNIALHIGTLFSILIIFYKDIIRMLKNPRTMLLVIVATIPAVIFGLTCKKWVETIQNPQWGGAGLLITSAFLSLGYILGKNTPEQIHTENPDSLNQQDPGLLKINFLKAFIIGCFQALAILPGISRSGSTISSSLAMGIPRTTSASFSFLMAVVAICGAVTLEAKDILTGESHLSTSAGPLAAGILTSAIVGVFALTGLLKALKSGRFHYFAIYCLAMGIFTLIYFWK